METEPKTEYDKHLDYLNTITDPEDDEAEDDVDGETEEEENDGADPIELVTPALVVSKEEGVKLPVIVFYHSKTHNKIRYLTGFKDAFPKFSYDKVDAEVISDANYLKLVVQVCITRLYRNMKAEAV